MAFKMRGTPVINGTALHKHARSAAVKKAADDQLRQKIAQQNAQGSEMNPADPNSPLALRGRLQDKINERLNRNVTIGTRMDKDGNEVVTKTVERDRIFGGGRTSRTRDKRNWDIENVAPENRAERTVDPSQEFHTDDGQGPIVTPDLTGPDVGAPGIIKDPKPGGTFPIREGDGPIKNPVVDPIVKLPPKEQEELVVDITDENVDDETLLQKYGSDILEGLGYIMVPGYGLIKEGSALYEQGAPEYFDRFGGLIGDIGGYIFGEPEQGIQASGSGQAGGGRGKPFIPPKDITYGPIGRVRTAEVVQASDGSWHHPNDVGAYEESLRRGSSSR